MAATHFADPRYPALAACGHPNAVAVTSDIEEVDCGNCRRTEAHWEKARPGFIAKMEAEAAEERAQRAQGSVAVERLRAGDRIAVLIEMDVLESKLPRAVDAIIAGCRDVRGLVNGRVVTLPSLRGMITVLPPETPEAPGE